MNSGNINSPSQVVIPVFGVQLFLQSSQSPEALVAQRLYFPIPITGTGSLILTDSGSLAGKALFSQILSVQVTPLGDPGLALSCYGNPSSVKNIDLYVYDNIGLYGGSINVQVLVLGVPAT